MKTEIILVGLCCAHLATSFRMPWIAYNPTQHGILGKLSQTVGDSDLNSMETQLVNVGENSDPLSVIGTFSVMAEDAVFREKYWQQQPFLVQAPLKNLKECFTMDHVKEAIDGDFLEAGRGSFQHGKSGWLMAPVSTPKGQSFQEAKLQYDDVLVALKQSNGTVVVNSAGGFVPRLASVCLDTVSALQLPVAINMYLTNPGQKTSAPPHTDKQDVFVLQTSGYKHWRVYAPPPPSRMPRADPFARGKGNDVMAMAELSEEPLIETTLGPGQILYVPAGYPHTTDTIKDIPEDGGPSVHLTIGVDTLIWNLNYAGLRQIALQRAGMRDKLLLTKLPEQVYWSLQDSLPLGFLSESIMAPHYGYSAGMRKALLDHISLNLISRMRAAEPSQWSQSSDEEMIAALQLEEVVSRMILHHFEITDIFAKMYEDVAMKISPSKLDLSFFRSQPYFQKLEATMSSLLSWAAEGTNSNKNVTGKGSKKPKASSAKNGKGKVAGFG